MHFDRFGHGSFIWQVTLPQQGQMTSQHGRRAVDVGYNDVSLAHRPRGDERISRVLGSVVDFDLFQCFETLLPHIQLIWELVLLGQVKVYAVPFNAWALYTSK